MKLIFYTTKGLEEISKREIKQFDIEIIETKTKRLIGIFDGDLEMLNQLKTVDDIGLLTDDFTITKQDNTALIIDRILKKDFQQYVDLLSELRPIKSNFSITLSKFKPKLNLEDYKEDIARKFSQKYSYSYTEKDHTNLDIRISVERNKFNLALRVFDSPLHERRYRTVSYMGSLKPTIAASMIQLAKDRTRKHHRIPKMVDIFCGSGTILCEAYLQGFEVHGSDVNPISKSTATEHLKLCGVKSPDVKTENAFSTSWDNNSFDILASNLPWDEQLDITSITELYTKTVGEIRRILKPEAIICLIVKKPDLLIKHLKINFPEHKIETYRVSFKGQQPTIILAYPRLTF
jgi:23S rRNA G2445 N2-methylase RlmL